MSTETIDKNAEELESTDTVECGGYCGDTVVEGGAVDVVVGQAVDKYEGDDEYPPHIAVAGADGKYPEVEKWCATCSESEFGVKNTGREKIVEATKTKLTRSNLKSFATGLSVGLFILAFILIFLP